LLDWYRNLARTTACPVDHCATDGPVRMDSRIKSASDENILSYNYAVIAGLDPAIHGQSSLRVLTLRGRAPDMLYFAADQ
jgi:hypothetical protein